MVHVANEVHMLKPIHFKSFLPPRSITSWKTIFLLLYFTFAFLCIGKCQAVIFWSLENKLEIRSFKPVLLGGKSDNGLILKWTGFCKLVKEKNLLIVTFVLLLGDYVFKTHIRSNLKKKTHFT